MNSRQPDVERPEPEPRNITQALMRGMRRRCPRCGTGALFRKYLKVVDRCPVCGEEFHHHRADDAPPYFTIVIVGHLIVPLLLIAEIEFHPALWVHFVIWIPLVIGLSLFLLPVVKGAIVALQWAEGMHGFGESRAANGSPPGDEDTTYLAGD